jgi:hypothetical protein
MSLKTRIKKLERDCGGEDEVLFMEVIYEGNNTPEYVIAMVNNLNEETEEIIKAYRREHPGIEVRVQSRCD